MTQHIDHWGTATLVDTEQKETTDHQATLAAWFIEMEKQHPLWHQYVLGLIHLRDIPGQAKPAHKEYPEATHELLLMALDPETKPQPQEKKTWRPLHPPQISVQFTVNDDEQAKEICELAAKAIISGRLLAEPDNIMGGREHWVGIIRHTADHFTNPNHDCQKYIN